jgi:hypothetical protein
MTSTAKKTRTKPTQPRRGQHGAADPAVERVPRDAGKVMIVKEYRRDPAQTTWNFTPDADIRVVGQVSAVELLGRCEEGPADHVEPCPPTSR